MQEFEIGQEVTFNPYGNPIKGIVKEVFFKNIWGESDGRVYYKLTGSDGPLLTRTSGISIEESRYFEN